MKRLITLVVLLLALGSGEAWAVRVDFTTAQPDWSNAHIFRYFTPDGELSFWDSNVAAWERRPDGLYTTPTTSNPYSSSFGFIAKSDARPVNALTGYMTAHMQLQFLMVDGTYVDLYANDKLDANTGRADLSLFDLPEGDVWRIHVLFSPRPYPGLREFLLTSIDFGTPPAVPVPGAFWLLGSGLVGLAALRRKKA